MYIFLFYAKLHNLYKHHVRWSRNLYVHYVRLSTSFIFSLSFFYCLSCDMWGKKGKNISFYWTQVGVQAILPFVSYVFLWTFPLYQTCFKYWCRKWSDQNFMFLILTLIFLLQKTTDISLCLKVLDSLLGWWCRNWEAGSEFKFLESFFWNTEKYI